MKDISDYFPGDEKDPRSPYFDDKKQRSKDATIEQIKDHLKQMVNGQLEENYCLYMYRVSIRDIVQIMLQDSEDCENTFDKACEQLSEIAYKNFMD